MADTKSTYPYEKAPAAKPKRRRVKRKTATKKTTTTAKKPSGENRIDDLVQQLNAHLNADLEPVPAEPEDKKEAKAKKPEKLTGEARVDKLVASLNAQFNANLEPTEGTGR